jgi:hypothetical protein
MPSHLLRCQGLAVDDHSFALGRLEAEAPSTFAQLRFYIEWFYTVGFTGMDVPSE